MKSLLCLLAMLFAVNFSNAQTTHSGDETFTYNSNIVYHYGLGWYSDADASAYGPMAYLSGFGGLKFFTAGAFKGVLDVYGNLGIGTATPLQKFSVNGSSGFPATSGTIQHGLLAISNNDTYSTLYAGAIGTASYATWLQASGRNDLSVNYPLSLNPNGGNVGIGIINPNGKLDVNGAILLPGSNTNTMVRPAVGSTRIAGEISGYSRDGLTGDDGFLRISAGGGTNSIIKSYIDLSGYSTVPDMAENITLGTAGTERMRVTSAGSVAIGTTDPHGYKLAVNGAAIATSMTVKLYADWPDYVFKSTYQLPKLSEVKSYIDQNQHLPEMPSETEVKKDGINLGEMVKIQTKKIEELTLYLIEQKSDIEKLKAAVKQLSGK